MILNLITDPIETAFKYLHKLNYIFLNSDRFNNVSKDDKQTLKDSNTELIICDELSNDEVYITDINNIDNLLHNKRFSQKIENELKD